MLLEKGVDEIIVGENYISYLLAFNLINKGKKVLIIDDDRVEIGEQFINRMSELDKAFAMEWGNNLGIGPFMEIDKYVRRDRYILHIDSHQLLLGQDFYQNWLELIRKFPLFFDINSLPIDLSAQEVNRQFAESMPRVAQHCFHFRTFQNFNIEDFYQNLPGYFKSFVQTVLSRNYRLNSYSQEDQMTWRSFIFCCQYLFQNKMTENISEVELAHLLLCLLIPHYKIINHNLVKDLSHELEAAQGKTKLARIESWQFHKKQLQGVQLSSFEGVYRPNVLTFLGHPPKQSSIEVEVTGQLYSGHHYEIRVDGNRFDHLLEEKHVFINSELLGTQLPIFEISFTSGKDVKAYFTIPDIKGSKNKFYEKEVLALINKYLNKLCSSAVSIVDFKGPFSIGDKYLYTPPNSKLMRPKRSQGKGLAHLRPKVVENCRPNKKTRIKGVDYWGPLKAHGLGLFSFLMDLKNNSYAQVSE